MITGKRLSSADLFEVLAGLARAPDGRLGARVHKDELEGALAPLTYDGVVTKGEMARVQRLLPELDAPTSTRGTRGALAKFRAENGAGKPGKMESFRRAEAFANLESHLRFNGAWKHGRVLTPSEVQTLLRILGDEPAPARVAQVRELAPQLVRAGHSTPETRAIIDAWLTAHQEKKPEAALDGQLQPIIGALRWPSESDREVYSVSFGKARAMPSPSRMLDKLGESASTPIEVRDFAETFDHLTQVDDPEDTAAVERSARFAQLRAVLEANLTDLRVYRVGTIDIDLYVLGRTASGELAGVGSSVVET